MAGRGTTFALQASVVRPVKAPQLGDPAPPAGAAQREMSEAIEEAWRYSRYGEIHQAVKGKASVVSSAAFGPGYIDQRSNKILPVFDPDGKITEGATVALGSDLVLAFADVLSQLAAGPGGFARLIFELSVCYDVEGGAVLVGGWVDEMHRPIPAPAEGSSAPEGAREMWRFVGTQRISYKADLKTGENRPALDGQLLPEDAIVQRCMVPWPDSAEHGVAWVLAALEPIRDLLVFTAAQRSIGRSNVPADLTLVPDEANPNPMDTPSQWADHVSTAIGEAATKALGRSNAGGQVVGPVLSVKADYVEKFKRMNLSKPVTVVFKELIDQARQRINEIADEAVENVAGLGATNRWNAEKISDQSWRRWYGPMVREIASTLMQSAAAPLLEADGFTRADMELCAIWVDPSAIVGKPDQAGAADNGLRFGAIGHSAWRDARGFEPEDAPTPEELELIERLTRKQTEKNDTGGDSEVNDLAGAALVLPAERPAPASPSVQAAAAAPTNQIDVGRAVADAERRFMDRVMSAAAPAALAGWERLQGRARNEARSLGVEVKGPHVFAALAAESGSTLTQVVSSHTLQAADAPGAAVQGLDEETEDASQEWWLALLALPLIAGGTRPTRGQVDEWSANAGAVAADRLRSWLLGQAAAGAETPGALDDTPGVVPTAIARRAESAAVGLPAPEGLDFDPASAAGPAVADPLVAMFGLPVACVWRYGPDRRTHPFRYHVDQDGKPIPIDGRIVDTASPWGFWSPGDHKGCKCQSVPEYDYLQI